MILSLSLSFLEMVMKRQLLLIVSLIKRVRWREEERDDGFPDSHLTHLSGFLIYLLVGDVTLR
jgi:hypothetical protein